MKNTREEAWIAKQNILESLRPSLGPGSTTDDP